MALIFKRGREIGCYSILVLVCHSLLLTQVARAECVEATPAWLQMDTQTIQLSDASNHEVSFLALIADEPQERAAGYQHICPEAVSETAILFVFQRVHQGRFHMRNVYAPLDIVFFDDNGKAVDVVQMRAEPPGLPVKPRLYQSRSPYRYALETPAGFIADNDLNINQLRIKSDAISYN